MFLRSHPQSPKNAVYGTENARNKGFGIGSNMKGLRSAKKKGLHPYFDFMS
jgi:hypothetical protein